tara:strand:+ start:131 stop:520 length:390 start_codon:yes stop_codon:yes gene_type:complete
VAWGELCGGKVGGGGEKVLTRFVVVPLVVLFVVFLVVLLCGFQANMDGAVNGMKARIQALQGKLKNKKLKQRSAVEDELKHLVEQMGAAQHDIDENEGKTRGLLSQKQKLTNKINAKKSSLTKFRSGAL